MAEGALQAQVRTLVLTDLVGSTRLVETVGDREAASLFARIDRATRDLLSDHGGREIDRTDGFLMLFDRPLEAVRFVLDLHEALASLSGATGLRLEARAGIHVGEVILRENHADDVALGAKPLEVEGMAKPRAARVMSLAGGGQTLLTRGAFDLARQAAVGVASMQGVHWASHGAYTLKGVPEPVEIFEVAPAAQQPSPPADTDKAVRVRAKRRWPAVVLAALVVLGVAGSAWMMWPAPERTWPVVSEVPEAQAAFEAAAEAFRDGARRSHLFAEAAVAAAPDAPMAWVLLAQTTEPTEANEAMARAVKLVEGRNDDEAVFVRLLDEGVREAEYGSGPEFVSEMPERWAAFEAEHPLDPLRAFLVASYYPVHGSEPDFHASEERREHYEVRRLKAFLAENPEWHIARTRLVAKQTQHGDEVDADVLLDGLARCPTCTQLRAAYGSWLVSQGRDVEGRSEMLRALEDDPALVGVRGELADLAAKAGDEEERVRLAAAQLAPENAAIARASFASTHGWVLMKTGRPRAGMQMLLQAVDAFEEAGAYDVIPNTLLGLSFGLLSLDELDTAERVLAEATEWSARLEVSDRAGSQATSHSMIIGVQLAIARGDLATANQIHERMKRVAGGRLPEDARVSNLAHVALMLQLAGGDTSALDAGSDVGTCGSAFTTGHRYLMAGDVDNGRSWLTKALERGDCGSSDVGVLARVLLAELTDDPEARVDLLAPVAALWPQAEPDGAFYRRAVAAGMEDYRAP